MRLVVDGGKICVIEVNILFILFVLLNIFVVIDNVIRSSGKNDWRMKYVKVVFKLIYLVLF